MVSNSLNIKTCFNLSSSPKGFVITDNTDYAGEGVALSDVVGIITAEDPSGNVFYLNNDYGVPDVGADVSLDSAEIPLPLDLEGEVKKGSYTITYSIRVAGINYYSKQFVYNYDLVLPTPSLDFTVNVNAAQVKSVDTTNYGQYKTSLTRLQTVKYPQSLNPAIADETSELESFIVGSPIYTKTWTSILESTVEFTLPDGLCVTADLKAVKDLEVSKNQTLCEAADCIKALFDKWKEASCSNPKEANRLEGKLIEVSALYVLVEQYEVCGEVDKSQDACKKIIDLVSAEGCECGCVEDSDEPEQILPLYGAGGSGGTTVVQSGNNGILVSANTVGSTTTYTLKLDDSVLSNVGTKWFSGSGVPSTSLGVEGDYYIDSASSNQTYYLKTGALTWTSQGDLKGADGESITSGITYDGGNVACFTFLSTQLNNVISDLATAICDNTTAIAQNASDIATNASNIATNTAGVADNDAAAQAAQDSADTAQQAVGELSTSTQVANQTIAEGGIVQESAFQTSVTGLNVTLDNGSGGASKGIDGNGDAINEAQQTLTLSANSDNYVDAKSGDVKNTSVAIGDPAPTLSAGYVRLHKLQTDASSVVSQEDLRTTTFVDESSVSDGAITGNKLEVYTTAKNVTDGGVIINYDDKGRVANVEERYEKVVVTPAQLADAHNNDVTLLSSSPGKFLFVDSIHYQYVKDTAAYNAAVDIDISYNGITEAIHQLPSGVISTNVDQTGRMTEVVSTSGGLRVPFSDPLVLRSSADLGGTGDGYLVLYIKYSLYIRSTIFDF